MYYPIGLPKRLKIPQKECRKAKYVVCNRDRVFFAILTTDCIWIWFSRPSLPLASYQLSSECLETYGTNELLEWRPDSSMIVVKTSKNYLIYYKVSTRPDKSDVYVQEDSNNPVLRRESAELYTRERIPYVCITKVHELQISGGVTYIVCLRDELMVATANGQIQRLRWDSSVNYDYCIDLRRVPFCDDQLVMKAIPLDTPGAHIIDLEYSPLVGGFAAVLNDGRAAFLTASTLKFDPNAVQGIWAKELEDATCAAINHKYRLLAYGRDNSQGIVYMIDEASGGLEISHRLILSDRDYSGSPGAVEYMKWSPDGTVLALCWRNGGMSLWSVFGSLLTASLRWDYSESPKSLPLCIPCMEWGAEGYELWCIQTSSESLHKQYESPSTEETFVDSSVLVISFLKSAISVNPCMSRLERVLLQGTDRLYLSTSESLKEPVHTDLNDPFTLYYEEDDDTVQEFNDQTKSNEQMNISSNKQWVVIQIPYTYTGANWPIRYTCVDDAGELVGVAGRNGVAHYSLKNRRWHLFGNESQEEDVVVTGGLVWWKQSWLVFGAYNIPANADEIRLYPSDKKLDNEFATTVPQPSQVLLINIYNDQLIVLTADCHITVYNLRQPGAINSGNTKVSVTRVQEVDISGLTVHPACVISVALTSLRTESWRSHSSQPEHPPAQSVLFNISGKVLMIQRDSRPDSESNLEGKLFQSAQMTPIVLASCCESLWYSNRTVSQKPHLSHALWLHCGAHGTRAWLPLFPNAADKSHNFMARRIMLPFIPSIYPLSILFEEGIMLGAETDTSLIGCDISSLHQPVTVVERTSQVYIHHILRQLLRRNLGYHAWEIASTCRNLPYFPHALELLLHQVLEEEATSKDPLPDSLLPRVLDFIREFPVYLLTIVQCARKTELALWRYLFSVAGSPRHLFMQALDHGQLDTAASYLIILQNLESANVSRQHATRLLDATLEAAKWDLSNDLIRFLRSIDPSDLESPRTCASLVAGSTKVGFTHATPPVSPQCADEDLSMILPNTQALRGRTYSAASGAPKLTSVGEGPTISPNTSLHIPVTRTASDSTKVLAEGATMVAGQRKRSSNSSSKDIPYRDEYFIDNILQLHCQKLLLAYRLKDLGTMSAHLNFPLVSWLRKEKYAAAGIEDFVAALKHVHQDFLWPYPTITQIRKYSVSSMCSMQMPNESIFSTEEAIRNLTVNAPKALGSREIGDSGYLSQATGAGETQAALTPQHSLHPLHSPLPELMPRQALLVPHSPLSGDLMSIMSEDASLLGEDANSLCGDWNPNDPTRDLLNRPPESPVQTSPKPPPHAEVQLRYLLQMLLEAGCLEWSIIAAIILRDAMAVLRVVALATDTSTIVLTRINKGLSALLNFTNTHCLGYQTFFNAIKRQIKELENIEHSREKVIPNISPVESLPNTPMDTTVASKTTVTSPILPNHSKTNPSQSNIATISSPSIITNIQEKRSSGTDFIAPDEGSTPIITDSVVRNESSHETIRTDNIVLPSDEDTTGCIVS